VNNPLYLSISTLTNRFQDFIVICNLPSLFI
jgi:hypothetical protein